MAGTIGRRAHTKAGGGGVAVLAATLSNGQRVVRDRLFRAGVAEILPARQRQLLPK